MGMKPRASVPISWEWERWPGHWMYVTLRDDGLTYMGSDRSPSGGDYPAGTQSITDFLEGGGIADMPSDVAAGVRAAIAKRRPASAHAG